MVEIELIKKARNGETSALDTLMTEYKNLVNKIARNYFIIGADFEDVIQEGMIGLFNAYLTFDENKSASFKTYATLLINRQIISAIKKAYKYKNLNFIEDFIINKESHSNLLSEIHKSLSELEIKILSEFLKNKSYDEIAKTLNLNKKSVDNALTRIRNKLKYLIK